MCIVLVKITKKVEVEAEVAVVVVIEVVVAPLNTLCGRLVTDMGATNGRARYAVPSGHEEMRENKRSTILFLFKNEGRGPKEIKVKGITLKHARER